MALDFQHRFTLTALAWQARQTPGRLFSRRQREACHKAAFGACACARVQGELVFRTADDVRQRHGGLRRAVEVCGADLAEVGLGRPEEAARAHRLRDEDCARRERRFGRTLRQGAASRFGTRCAADTPRTRRGGRGRSRCGSGTGCGGCCSLARTRSRRTQLARCRRTSGRAGRHGRARLQGQSTTSPIGVQGNDFRRGRHIRS
jgi:hypothetical protein